MSKIWFCRNCGYEVASRGRCHACKVRLSSSPLPELQPGDEEEEVGYRLPDWSDQMRGRLIVRLIEANVLHRFDEDELIVALDDEPRTDDLVEEIAAGIEDDDDGEDDGSSPEVADPVDVAAQEDLRVEVEILFSAARRLQRDPTDMQADGDLGLSSGAVFMAERFDGADPETWAAVGRVTRRLLGALGAEEALEDEIRLQAGILVKLVEPLVDVDPGPLDAAAVGTAGSAGTETGVDTDAAAVGTAGDAVDPRAEAEARTEAGTEVEAGTDAEADGEADAAIHAAAEHGEDEEPEDGDLEDEAPAGESVYELPEWLPEQRAELSLHLDEAAIPHEWEGGDLVVGVAAEAEVEALFDRVEGVSTDEDDEARYRALEALFAAADRFVNDPDSRPKRMEVVRAVAEAEGPTPLGLDDAQWWSIRSRARLLADSIEHDANLEVVFSEATALRDMLRVLV